MTDRIQKALEKARKKQPTYHMIDVVDGEVV